MKIYTKTGDTGETGLYRGGRVSKDSLRIASYGTVDELNSHLGWIRTLDIGEEADQLLQRVQNDLFVIGADLATPAEAVKTGDNVTRLSEGAQEFLEEAIDQMESRLEPQRVFILPGGCKEAAAVHIARTVCRRAERGIVTLARSENISPSVVIYLNRLSDFLFVLARDQNRRAGVNDVPWQK